MNYPTLLKPNGIKFSRQLTFWGLLTLIIGLTLVSDATVQRTDSQNQKPAQQKLETSQELRGSKSAIKNYLREIENERNLNTPQNDFIGKDSVFLKNAKLQSPSSLLGLDNSFDGSLSDRFARVEAVAVQSDGKILVGGDFSLANGVRRSTLVRFNVDGSLDSAFSPGIVGNPHTIQVQPDGKILIGGTFGVGGGVHRLNPDGTLDPTFDPGVGLNSLVNDIFLLPDGKIIASGGFTVYRGTAVNRIVKLNSNGSLDTSFTVPPINNAIQQAALQSDGKILIAGNFTIVNGLTRRFAARLNADGSLDTNFDSGTNLVNTSFSVAVQPDGKILVGAPHDAGSQQINRSLTRLNSNGSIDVSFTLAFPPTSNSSVHKIVILTDGKILIGGAIDDGEGNFFNVGKINSDGSLDPNFSLQPAVDSNGFPEAFSIALTPDGKIVAGGDFYKIGSSVSLNKHVVRLNSNGTTDTGFTGSVVNFGIARAVVQQGDGKIVVGGAFKTANGAPHSNIARFNIDGSIDSSFIAGTDIDVSAIAIQSDGKLLIGGSFSRVNGEEASGAARLNSDGTLDPTFDVVGVDRSFISTIAIQPDGKILGGGSIFTALSPTGSTGIIRINTNGSVDNSFAINTNSTATTKISLMPNGQMYVGGTFANFAGSGKARIVRLNSDGTVDNTFNTGTGPNGTVSALAQQPDGRVLIGGSFTSLSGVNTGRIARLNTNGSIDSTFDTGIGFDSAVVDLTLQANGQESFSVLVGGAFSTYNATGRRHLARINLDGSLDAFSANVNATVHAIAFQTDGKVLTGGIFTSVGGQIRNGLARLNVISGDPCNFTSINIGQTINGSLSLASCDVGESPTDLYTFSGTAGQQIVVSLDSPASGGIQPSLQLVGSDGVTVLQSSSGGTNARIPAAGVFTLPSAGVYTIRVSTLDNVGAYTLSLVQPPANVTCVYAPSPTNTNVAPSGVPASGGTSFFFDVLTQDGCPSASAAVGPGSEHISIVSNSGGRVTFNVSPHSGQAARVGTILAGERVHTVTQFGVTPPANDTFLQAQTLPSTSGSVPGRNTDAAAEAGEPQHLQGEAVGRSVWYKWTAPSEGGRYSFTTSGSDFDTVMAIYTGTSVGGLTRIAGNDDTTSFDLTSKVNFFSTGGTTYYIAVDGKSGASGSIQLSYSPFRRLFRLYLQNFNGTASPISPSSVTTRREDGTGQTITGDFISLGVYEFDLPEDNAFYTVTIEGPAGITWSPPTYRINNSSSAFNPLMMNLQGGDGGTGQNQISNATNTIPRKFKGFVHGISNSADLALFSVHIGSTGTSSAVAPINCSNPPFTTPPHLVTGGPGGAMRVQYECETQPNTTHQILPSAPGKAFVVPALPLQVLNTDSGPFDANAITAVNSATYSIGGRITANGQGLGGAIVDISSGIISIRTTSNGNGDYVFPDLAPNLTYMVKATRGGFVFQPQPVTLQSSNVTLNITAQACAFTLSGFGQFEEDGGLGQIGVTATNGQTCEWTAERGANSEWININSGGSLGSGQVQFTVQSNNGAARTGTIIAGGQIFTVSQFSRINVVQPFSTRFDFDGDRNADLSVYRPSNNLWYVRRSTAGYMTADYAGAQGDFMAPADYDGDRKADIAFFRPSNGTWYIFGSATQTLSTFGWGQSGDIPAPADHDGDRKADLVVFRPSTGTWFRKLSLDDSLSATFFGTNGDKPVIGDFDGDGKDDIALYRVSDNNWYILKTRDGFAAHTWGQSGDIPVPADYNGDGITDIVIYRPLTGQWYRILSNRGIDIRSWGEPGDIPVAADYDADGRVDIAIYRPSNVTWYIVGTSAGIFLDQFGTAEDRPTPNSFAY